MPEPPRYEVLAEIGSGGMGIVYKARDRETAEIVALKVLKPEISSDAEMLKRFKNELRLARRITHKNVCRIFDLNRFDGGFCISMELVEGESLRAILKRIGALGIRKGLQIAQQICAGLGEAHAQGIVHRDLKPENIMLDRAGRIKIMDFGIARAVDMGVTTLTAIVGTPSYMSPEQAQSKPADQRSDIYSLGLVLYEIFTGKVAFRGETPIAVALKHVWETPQPPGQIEPSLPAYLDGAIMRCLEKHPGHRFQSVAELEEVLLDRTFWTPADMDTPEIARPVRAERWERSDSGLLGGAVLSIALFFSMFTMPASPALVTSLPARILFMGPALLLFILGLFVYRKLYMQAPSAAKVRIAAVLGAGAGLGAIGAIPEYQGPGALFFKFGMPLLTFFLGFIATYCIVTTVLYYGRRRCPIQVSRYLLFASEEFFSRPVGLDLLRGLMTGMIFAGIWTALIGFFERSGIASAGWSYWIGTDSRSGGSFPLLVFAENLAVPWLLIAFPMSVFAGLMKRVPLLLASLALLWLALGFSFLGALALPHPAFEVSIVLQAVFFGYIFQHYGITSAGASILTSEVFLLAVPLFLVFRNAEPFPHAVPIVVWILMLLVSCAAYFGAELVRACRRIAALFE